MTEKGEVASGGVESRSIAEDQSRPQCDPWPRVMPSHDRTHVISAGIKALNGTTLIVQHLRIDVGLKSDAGPYIAGPDLSGVEGWFLDGSHTRVRSVSRMPIAPIKRRFPLSEIWINATLGRVVVSKNRLPKPFRFHGGLSGQIFDGISRNEITILDVACQIPTARPDQPKAKLSKVLVVADQIGRNRRLGFMGLVHRQREIVVRSRCIRKSTASAVHGDLARLRSIP